MHHFPSCTNISIFLLPSREFIRLSFPGKLSFYFQHIIEANSRTSFVSLNNMFISPLSLLRSLTRATGNQTDKETVPHLSCLFVCFVIHSLNAFSHPLLNAFSPYPGIFVASNLLTLPFLVSLLLLTLIVLFLFLAYRNNG